MSCGTNPDGHRIAGAISENPLPLSGGKPAGRLAKRENEREKYPRLKYRGETVRDKLSRPRRLILAGPAINRVLRHRDAMFYCPLPNAPSPPRET